MQENFRRIESKYILDSNQYTQLYEKIKDRLVKDKYWQSTICNIYYDTDYHDLIRNSIEKPPYKEKVRMRSYNVPSLTDTIFLEIKKKYEGVVYKRRIKISLEEAYKYIENHNTPNCNKQIMKEIDYCFERYNLKPVLFLSYYRTAYYDKDDSNLRITFDKDIVSRDYDLRLENGIYGERVEDDIYIMELKTITALPLWLTAILSEFKIYPKSFSKYGSIYQNALVKSRKEDVNV